MIQNVKIKWNNIYYMLKKVFLLRDVIQIWLDDQSCMQVLKIKNMKWNQISFILDMLKSFQEITKILESSNQSSIHKAWIVYNALHQHLKRYEEDLVENARDSSLNLRLTIQTAQNKLTKYYEAIFEAENLYFNLSICLNSCDKLNYYNVNSIFEFINRLHYVAQRDIMQSFFLRIINALCRATQHNWITFHSNQKSIISRSAT
jgi:hypothetical protein